MTAVEPRDPAAGAARAARPLDRAILEAALRDRSSRVASLEVLREVDSTSSYLARCELPTDGRVRICIAEHQTAGRGRRGRTWQSAAGAGITLSIARAFPGPVSGLVPLGIVVGVLAARALRAHGVERVGLKWPNDLLVESRKLGGVLVEVDGREPPRAIIGLGLNYDSAALESRIDQASTDVCRSAACRPERSALAGALLAELVSGLDRFVATGLPPFRAAWNGLDVLAGRTVCVDTAAGAVHGTARGIAEDGGLRVDTHTGSRVFHSGEVSVRTVA